MKKIIYSLAAVIMATSCAGILDEVNYGNPTIEDMMANEENVILQVGQIYANVKFTHDHWGYWGLMTITADEGICVPRNKGNDWNDGGYWVAQNSHTWNHKGDAIKEVWNITVSGAVSCNQIIQTLDTYKDNMDEQVYNQYKGEVEVMRTYYFYQLFECFGRIPYTEKFEEATGPLYETPDAWSNLVATLERNAPNLPVVTDANRGQHYGRVTQGFAYALLARLYLNAESYGCTLDNVFSEKSGAAKPEAFSGTFYDNCVRCCDEVINSGSYEIDPDYFANFAIENDKSKESIFSIVENGLSTDSRDFGKTMNKLRIPLNTHHYGIQKYYGLLTDTWNGFAARPEYLDLFKSATAPAEVDLLDVSTMKGYYNSDVRGPGTELNGTANEKQWGWFVGPVHKKGSTTALFPDEDYDNEGTIIRVGFTDTFEAHNFDGARLNKWELDKTSTYTYCENDMPIIRYADVLLMKLEAINVYGAAGDAAALVASDDFQTLMKRSFAYDTKPLESYVAAYGDPTAWDAEKILAERGREFSWEMVRRRDLIRHDKFGTIQYVTNSEAVRKWFPIPYSILEKSLLDENGNKIWTQTPGYENL